MGHFNFSKELCLSGNIHSINSLIGANLFKHPAQAKFTTTCRWDGSITSGASLVRGVKPRQANLIRAAADGDDVDDADARANFPK